MAENDNDLTPEAPSPPAAAGADQGRSWTWQLGTVVFLGGAAVVAVLLYQQLQSRVENVTRVILKREDYQDFRRAIWDQIGKQHERNQSQESELKQRFARLEVQAKVQEEKQKLLAPDVCKLHDELSASLKDSCADLERQARAGAAKRHQLLEEIKQMRERVQRLEGTETTSLQE